MLCLLQPGPLPSMFKSRASNLFRINIKSYNYSPEKLVKDPFSFRMKADVFTVACRAYTVCPHPPRALTSPAAFLLTPQSLVAIPQCATNLPSQVLFVWNAFPARRQYTLLFPFRPLLKCHFLRPSLATLSKLVSSSS